MKTCKKVLMSTMALSSILALSACSGLKGGQKNSQTKDGKTNIVMYQIGEPAKNFDTLMKNANKIIEKETGAHLDIKFINWGDYNDKMAIMTSSGEQYDIAFSYNYAINAQKGAYADLTDLYKKEGKALYDILDPAYIKGNKVNGKIYAVPVIGNIANQQMFSFNKELVDKYHFDISSVKTYEDLEPMLAVIKEKEPKVTPMAYTKGTKVSDNFDYILGDIMPFAVDLEGDPTKIVNQYEVPHFQKHLKTVHNYYKAGYIPSDVATSDAEFKLSVPNWFVHKETQGPADLGDSLLTTVAGFPIVSRPLTNAYKTSGSVQAANFVISSTSKNKAKAMEVLTLLNTNKELLNGLVFGPEGTNWEKVPGKKDTIKLLKGYSNDTRMPAWNTGNSQLLYRTENVTDADVAQSEKVLKEAVESPALGFSFNTDPVKTEITRLQNIMNQYNASIHTGTVDPDKSIPELMDLLNKEEAYTKVMKEMQKQYDAFLAKK
ncbi:ABC transporter substrate-binding protein [Streptococcus iniae]|uniref:ABC transporter substrate-binding protein n=2 Tax=Streptococcus iniae TaxID=1346 RepID=UPI000EF785DD|nr:ABC transporter substrate-binding protein [Streptococcus iniae]RLU43767.1 sugar ABC transporter substrate-binding protein [Streptococcus iniae]RMI57829.1 sugar ABC transporter substrate-binding protein [Streptococcus iniae]RMI59260.1 sugar ABC transporter substrate-binding protein [Streptococcus iniae]RMI61517.1 sugar ABC transporter substrate-binding protein [Streptococcus iniae]RMI77042.1 sugar ABC transporter substrate-binding protein [Streptococcus iniae]